MRKMETSEGGVFSFNTDGDPQMPVLPFRKIAKGGGISQTKLKGQICEEMLSMQCFPGT